MPGEIVTLELWEKEEMYDAIKRLAVRGAPARGVFSAIGLSVLTARDKTADEKTLIEHFLENLEYLTSSRPVSYTHLDVYKRQGDSYYMRCYRAVGVVARGSHVYINTPVKAAVFFDFGGERR